MKIAFVGTGNLLEALLAGAVRGGIPRDWLMCSTHTAERAYWLGMHYGVACAPSNLITVRDANLVLVGVRPDQVIDVLAEIRDDLRPGAVVASASAVSELAELRAALPPQVACCRIMPSIAARVGHGICGVAFDDGLLDEQRELVTTFLASMGEVLVLPEDELGRLGAINSGPAYVAALLKALVDGAIENGTDPEQARRLILETALGTVALLEPAAEDAPRREFDFDEIAGAVGHPGGSTVRSLDYLRTSGALDAVQAAVSHSFER